MPCPCALFPDFGLAINSREERPVTRLGTLDYMVRCFSFPERTGWGRRSGCRAIGVGTLICLTRREVDFPLFSNNGGARENSKGRSSPVDAFSSSSCQCRPSNSLDPAYRSHAQLYMSMHVFQAPTARSTCSKWLIYAPALHL